MWTVNHSLTVGAEGCRLPVFCLSRIHLITRAALEDLEARHLLPEPTRLGAAQTSGGLRNSQFCVVGAQTATATPTCCAAIRRRSLMFGSCKITVGPVRLHLKASTKALRPMSASSLGA